MIELVKEKIKSLEYKESDSLKELYKLLGILKFVVMDIARGCTPPYTECLEAHQKLADIENQEQGKNANDFDSLKNEILSVLDSLNPFLSEINKFPSISELMSGKKKVQMDNDLKFALLIVEQNNIDFFKDRPTNHPYEPHNRLMDHIWIQSDASALRFGFIDNSELPSNIKAEVESAFNEVLGKYGATKLTG
jgi:hypothetical protein